jgi:hypothetical protein
VSAGGADERLDVAGVQLGAAVGEPLVRVGSDECKVGGQVGEVLAGVVDVGDVRRVGVEVTAMVQIQAAPSPRATTCR